MSLAAAAIYATVRTTATTKRLTGAAATQKKALSSGRAVSRLGRYEEIKRKSRLYAFETAHSIREEASKTSGTTLPREGGGEREEGRGGAASFCKKLAQNSG